MAKWEVEERRTITTRTKRKDGKKGQRQGD